MLELFLKFISNIATKVFEKYSPDRDPTGKGLRKLFTFYTQLCRIHDYLERFTVGLKNWKASRYYGREWSGCQHCISQLAHILAILEDDLDNIIALDDFDLSCDIKGYLNVKRNVFQIWRDIVVSNSNGLFCGWHSDYSGTTWKKTIYIPNYSLILSQIRPTSELSDIAGSYWSAHLIDLRTDDLSNTSLQFLPELSPDKIEPSECDAMVKHYCKAIVLPDEEEEIERIIEITRSKVEELRILLKKLGDMIKRFAGDNSAVFLKFV